MSIRFRSSIRSTRTETFGWAWAAIAEDDGTPVGCLFGYAPTQAKALEEAYTALKQLEQQQMDAVHAERAGRRPALIPEIDIHTMEATA